LGSNPKKGSGTTATVANKTNGDIVSWENPRILEEKKPIGLKRVAMHRDKIASIDLNLQTKSTWTNPGNNEITPTSGLKNISLHMASVDCMTLEPKNNNWSCVSSQDLGSMSARGKKNISLHTSSVDFFRWN